MNSRKEQWIQWQINFDVFLQVHIFSRTSYFQADLFGPWGGGGGCDRTLRTPSAYAPALINKIKGKWTTEGDSNYMYDRQCFSSDSVFEGSKTLMFDHEIFTQWVPVIFKSDCTLYKKCPFFTFYI